MCNMCVISYPKLFAFVKVSSMPMNSTIRMAQYASKNRAVNEMHILNLRALNVAKEFRKILNLTSFFFRFSTIWTLISRLAPLISNPISGCQIFSHFDHLFIANVNDMTLSF